MVGSGENVELSTAIKDDARFFTLIAKEEDAVAATELKLPGRRQLRRGKYCIKKADRLPLIFR